MVDNVLWLFFTRIVAVSRKEFAKDYYLRELSKGKNEIEVKEELTELLGHNRMQVLDAYLK